MGIINASVLSMGLLTHQVRRGCIEACPARLTSPARLSACLHPVCLISTALSPLQGPPEWHPAPAPLQAAAREAAAAAQAHGVSLPRLALKEAVKDEAIASHLVGFCTRQQVLQAGSLCCAGMPTARPACIRKAALTIGPCARTAQVADNVEAVLQGLGLLPSAAAEAEAAALADVQRLLAPVQGVTWPSGLPENN